MNTYYDSYLYQPDRWPLPVVPVPNKLNPFASDGVELWLASAMYFPGGSHKYLTVLGMINGAEKAGLLGDDTQRIIEGTSGGTGNILVPFARSRNKELTLVTKDDLPDGKKYPLRLAGVKLVHPDPGVSSIVVARKEGGGGWKPENWRPNNGCLNLDQYANMDGTTLHTKVTAKKIWESLAGNMSVFTAPIGTGGTLVGVSRSLRNAICKVKIWGALCAPGQEIPGCRDRNQMKEIKLPWQESADEITEVRARPSYLASLWLYWLTGLPVGPSSGFAYLGALQLLHRYKTENRLGSLRNQSGIVRLVTFAPDANNAYGDRFMANLPIECQNPATAPLPWKWPGEELFKIAA